VNAPRRPVSIGQTVTWKWQDRSYSVTRNGNEKFAKGKESYRLTVHEDGSHDKAQTFAQSILWFWARGLTPTDPVCPDCGTTDGVRMFPCRYSPFGESPRCPPCKSKSLIAGMAKAQEVRS